MELMILTTWNLPDDSAYMQCKMCNAKYPPNFDNCPFCGDTLRGFCDANLT